MIPPPPGTEPVIPPPVDVPPPPDGALVGPGPRGLLAVPWSFGKALAIGFLPNLNFYATVLIIIASIVGGSEQFEQASSATTGGPEAIVGVVVELIWLGGMVVWLQRRYPVWRERIGITLGRRGVRDGIWGFVAGLIMYPAIAFVVGIGLEILFDAIAGHQVSTPDQLPGEMTPAATVITVVLAVGLAPIVEELCFRGLIFRSIRDRHGFWPGALVSGVCFGIVHYVPFNPWPNTVLLQTIMIFTGIGLAWIYERRGNLVSDIAAHMAFNTIGIILILTAR